MKYSSVFLHALLAVSLGISVHASVIPDDTDVVEDDGLAVVAAKGSDDGNGNGITTVADNKNPVCKPWYAIRDAIMGDIYHGQSDILFPPSDAHKEDPGSFTHRQ